MATRVRSVLRVLFGLLLLLHGLAHAVLPLRGIAVFPPDQVWMTPFAALHSALVVISYSIALTTLFGAGLGILGSRIDVGPRPLVALAWRPGGPASPWREAAASVNALRTQQVTPALQRDVDGVTSTQRFTSPRCLARDVHPIACAPRKMSQRWCHCVRSIERGVPKRRADGFRNISDSKRRVPHLLNRHSDSGGTPI